MAYNNHPAIVDALKNAKEWIEREGGRYHPASVAREIAKTSRDGISQSQTTCRIAALSLLLGGFDLNEGNIAWLVRDREIGFPERPTFKIA